MGKCLKKDLPVSSFLKIGYDYIILFDIWEDWK